MIGLGARRVIGDGVSTQIWGDPWVPKLPKFRVLPRSDVAGDGPMMVNQLICNGQWQITELNGLFTRWEVEELPKDCWTWDASKDGEFTVRSAYYLMLKEETRTAGSSSYHTDEIGWQQIWSAEIYPKTKHFIWRALHGGLAVRSQLAKRGISLDTMCPMCGEEEETIVHMLGSEESMVSIPSSVGCKQY